MTREEAKELLYNISAYDIDAQRGIAKQEAIEIAIQALEKEPCEDCISRSETIKYLNTNMAWYNEDGGMADSDEKLKAITDLINGVPSVTPQPKIGKWEWVQYDGNPNIGNWHCTECRSIVIKGVKKEKKRVIFPLYTYCPNCGAKMQEVEE